MGASNTRPDGAVTLEMNVNKTEARCSTARTGAANTDLVRGADRRSLPPVAWIPAEAVFGWLACGNPSEAAAVINSIENGKPISELTKKMEALEEQRDFVLTKIRSGELPVSARAHNGNGTDFVSPMVFSGSLTVGELTIHALIGCVDHLASDIGGPSETDDEAGRRLKTQSKSRADASHEAYSRVKNAGLTGPLFFRREDLIRVFCCSETTTPTEEAKPAAASTEGIKSQREKPIFDARKAKILLQAKKDFGDWPAPPSVVDSREYLKLHFRGVSNTPHAEIRGEVWGHIKRGRKPKPPRQIKPAQHTVK